MYFLNVFGVLISMAFFTLLERKFLGYGHFRSGPNLVGVLGLGQSFSDAFSLFSSEFLFVFSSNLMFIFFGSFMMLFLSLILWVLNPYFMGFYSFSLGFMFFLACVGLGSYLILFCGWGSNSLYSSLGSMRGLSQAISYEISISFLVLYFLISYCSYDFFFVKDFQEFFWGGFLSLFIFFFFFISLLAELSRTPFDFTEGESELVSGFNLEYSSYFFAFIFMSEYLNIIFMSFVFFLICLGGFSFIFSIFFVFFLSFIIIIIRGCLPRFRYDFLMVMNWSIFLPVSLIFIFYCVYLSF
uniref:NADH-ubiquinone oxidoreductase chain 1 n=1 Tax=Sinentomon erythranum TaxID=289455 RepID=G3D5P0_9HEXA|nr:NADH dehydrogenase subunit 1 [Sinentomon erythranum]ADN32967.1 NADH dehydrogenase subunit 1 [Sinentomon erythranum]